MSTGQLIFGYWVLFIGVALIVCTLIMLLQGLRGLRDQLADIRNLKAELGLTDTRKDAE